jgi:hypothetical protein
MGLGFRTWEPSEAAARFGGFPYWLFAYNSFSTVSNVLFAEPTSGLFFIARDFAYRQAQAWELVHLVSSIGLTCVIGWWGVRELAACRRGEPWSTESRALLVMLAALLTCGALSFDYSRDRLGGMAVVFYALTAFFALRAAMLSVADTPRPRFVAACAALTIVMAGWQVRAAATIEWTRRISAANERGWLVGLPERREEFANRAIYLEIMQSMIEQGTDPSAPRPTRYPSWIARTLGPF